MTITLRGKYADAKVFTDNIEQTATAQIINLLNQPFVEGSKVRIMSDVHAGAGCTIGFTADLGDKVIPNLVGVDLSCGMLVVELGYDKPDFAKLDGIIRGKVPSGKNAHTTAKVSFGALKGLTCIDNLRNVEHIIRSIGTLGSGNHFIEVDVDDEGMYYLVIHSGSRNLGKQVAEYHQSLAVDYCKFQGDTVGARKSIVASLKMAGESHKIAGALKAYDSSIVKMKPQYPDDLCFLEGSLRQDYLHDVGICAQYASLNRQVMANIILVNMYGFGISQFDWFQTVHNYIDLKRNLIRKGAISAEKGELAIIPMTMEDGSLIVRGKGNPDWNFSAPHGAGRLMGRAEAKRRLSMDKYKKGMADKGIYTTSVNENTLDECKDAYKPMEEIVANIGDTVDIIKLIKPVYNFKDSSKDKE